jgi:uncharacterized protein YkwD
VATACVAAAVLATGACAPIVPDASGGGTGSEAGSGGVVPRVPGRYAAVAEGVLTEANRARRAAGAASLQADPDLDRAAAEYASELADRGLLDHDSPTPGRRTVSQRVDAAGVAWTRVAENLGLVRTHEAAVGGTVVRLWLGSPGHRSNLLDAGYVRVGTGVARDRVGDWYVVQVYVTPRVRRE